MAQLPAKSLALRDIQALGGKVIVYTDPQNIMGLQGRRERFEKNIIRFWDGVGLGFRARNRRSTGRGR